MVCKICNGPTERLFSKTILKKYPAEYFRCPSCEFMQTSQPVWLPEAYGNAITSLDIGLAGRNVWLQPAVARIIDNCFPGAMNMLDFAGGYGLLVRLMRDHGYNFYRQDDYCENLFAKYFDLEDSVLKHFEVVTAFEVFEHFEDPSREIKRVLDLGDNLIFSTELIPEQNVQHWMYLAPETGQHIAFYSEETLRFIASQHKMHFYSNGSNLHIYSREPIPAHLAARGLDLPAEKRSLFRRLMNRLVGQSRPPVKERLSLRDSDYKKIQEIISKSQ